LLLSLGNDLLDQGVNLGGRDGFAIDDSGILGESGCGGNGDKSFSLIPTGKFTELRGFWGGSPRCLYYSIDLRFFFEDSQKLRAYHTSDGASAVMANA
jgi:hypothetical protein